MRVLIIFNEQTTINLKMLKRASLKCILITLFLLIPLVAHAYPAYNISSGVGYYYMARAKSELEGLAKSGTLPVRALLQANPPLSFRAFSSFFKFELFLNRNNTLFAGYHLYPPTGFSHTVYPEGGNSYLLSKTQPHGFEIGYSAIFPLSRNFEFRLGTSGIIVMRTFHFAEARGKEGEIEILKTYFNEPTFAAVSLGAFVGTGAVLSRRYRVGIDLQLNVTLYEEASLLDRMQEQADFEGYKISSEEFLNDVYSLPRIFELSELRIYGSLLLGPID